MKILKYSLLLILALGLGSCHKDDESIIPGETTIPSPTVIQATTGDILGYVYDEQSNPVGDVKVSVLGKTTSTNQYGVFKFKNIELDQQGSYIKAQKNGYILGSDMIFAAAGVNHTSRIKLLELSNTGTFSSTDGGAINVEGGGKVIFTPNSIVNEDGSSYTGNVTVTAKRIATDDPALADIMPGALTATDKKGRSGSLGTYGMVAVELRGAGGNELQLKSGATAEWTSPITEDLLSNAPEEIALWSFDEVNGIWLEDGIAKKEGNSYKGTVSHFSFWNCDVWFPNVPICGKVLYSDGTPANQIIVSITSESIGTAAGWTNEDGSFGGKVPKDEVLVLSIYNGLCEGNEAFYTAEIGPLSNKTFLDDIILALPEEHSFEGTVTCSGSPVPNATVIYNYNNGNSYVIESDEDGFFEINIDTKCEILDEITAFAIDPNTGMGSLTQILDPDTDPTYTFEVCNDCNFSVNIGRDPDTEICDNWIIKAFVDGSGNYEYTWKDGSTGETTEVVFGGQYCVTVTEVDLNCSMVMCSEEIGHFPFNLVLYPSASCAGEDGSIGGFTTGGYPPYIFDWSDPSLTVSNDSLGLVENVPAGTYQVTVTDSEGCTLESEVTLEAADGITVTLSSAPDCYGASIVANVTGGKEPYQYVWDPNFGVNNGPNVYAPEAGQYCVTVYDANGCQATECIEVVIEDILSQIDLFVTDCTDGTYTFFNNSNLDIEFGIGNEPYTVLNGEDVSIDFIPIGFNTQWIGGFITNLQCELEFPLEYPSLWRGNEGSIYTLTDRTCDTCDDAIVTFTGNQSSYTSRNGAMMGTVKLIDADYNDVTASAGALGVGTYYVVVTDSVTDCYIYSEKVIIV